jgi:hypothetical protein
MWLDHFETFTSFEVGYVFVFGIYNLEYLILYIF